MLKACGLLEPSHAKINDLTHVRKVMDEMTAILPHFSPPAQLYGLLGSSGPSHPTMLGSTSVCSGSGSFLLDKEPRWAASRSTSSSRLELADDFFSLSSEVEEAAGGVEDLVAPGSADVSFSGSVDDSNCSGVEGAVVSCAECRCWLSSEVYVVGTVDDAASGLDATH